MLAKVEIEYFVPAPTLNGTVRWASSNFAACVRSATSGKGRCAVCAVSGFIFQFDGKCTTLLKSWFSLIDVGWWRRLFEHHFDVVNFAIVVQP